MSSIKQWPRAILLIDMNAFFASVEQRDFPELRGRPVAVTNGTLGSCVITCSYEARSWGVKTGMRFKDAKQKCPDLVQRPSRPNVYAATSSAIMASLAENISPDIEVFSVDEAFLDMSAMWEIFASPQEMAQAAKDAVWNASGLLCSAGLAGDKTTAKFAAKQNKPNGLTIIRPDQAQQVLAPIPVEELCGINKGVQKFLNDRGVVTCGDMQRIPVSELGKRFGNIGRRIWLMAQGKDPAKLSFNVPEPKSIGHGKVLPPETSDKRTILMYFLHMCEKVAFRLRKNNMIAHSFFLGMRLKNIWLKTKCKTEPTQCAKSIYQRVHWFIENAWRGQGIWAIQVTALLPYPQTNQIDLFGQTTTAKSDVVMDQINQKYGTFTLTKASLLGRSSMPDVIAPAWKPDGHRQTIEPSSDYTIKDEPMNYPFNKN
ncbi:MAG: DNA polymerase IV [Kangiellaceae bacterium]|jgi:DNA polymerase-4|nr:DNA polymerase IV [Kangiellaceae bacterium]